MFVYFLWLFVFFFKQKTAYEMRISDWSSDVCSSDLRQAPAPLLHAALRAEVRQHQVGQRLVVRGVGRMDLGSPLRRLRAQLGAIGLAEQGDPEEIGRAACRERVCQYV